jgi:hypothetical protein
MTTSLWRYMDFTKYVDLLEMRSLYFCRSDKFEDPYEGIPHPSFIEEQRQALWNALSFDWGLALDTWNGLELKNRYELARSRILVSCWHENEVESAAMWKLYLTGSEGVAIKSSRNRLEKAIDKNCEATVARIKYVDFNTPLQGDWLANMRIDPALRPFILKRGSFSHEREVRAIIQVEEPPSHGKRCTVNTEELIESTYVSPTAPSWFCDLVESVNRRYGMITKVVQSKLYERPSIDIPEMPY